MIEKYFKEKIKFYEEISGHFNINYKVTTNNGIFHLKILKNNDFEIKPWIDGNVIKKWTKIEIKLVCDELIKLHTSSDLFKKMNFKTSVIKDEKYLSLIKKYQDTFNVPCHNDLNKDNIVIGVQKAYLIDFEFARMNNLHWEIANIINEDQLTPKQIDNFLKYYKELNIVILRDFIYINKVFNDYWKSLYWVK